MNEEKKISDDILSTIKEISDIRKFKEKGYNVSALVTSLTNSEFPILQDALPSGTRGLGEWEDVPCKDGSKARVLKNPFKAFELYGTQWSTKIKAIQDLLGIGKVGGNVDIEKSNTNIFKNLSYVDATIREMYKNAYLTFSSTPCDERSQDEKRKMDRIIMISSLYLTSMRLRLENSKTVDDESLSNDIQALMDKIIDMLSR